MTSFGRAQATPTRADQSTVRRANLGVVMQHVAARERCSRARIAAETGLTRGTVSSLVGELIELRLLRETGEDESPGSVGRPAQMLQLDDHVVAVGLEINVDYLAVWVEDLAGSVRFERRIYADNRRSAAGPILDRLAKLARQAIEAVERDGLQIAGIAVAVPGLVDVSSGRLLRAPNLGWIEVDVADELAARLGVVPGLRVENEANLAALAEHWMGVARGLRSFICIFGEVGVGAGIFVEGELFRGAHGFGGEFGHLTVDRDGAPCACGSRGCLETFVGQEAIARRAGVRASGGRTRSVTDQLVRRAGRGDDRTLRSLREAGGVLGAGIASAVNLFDVEAVVLGGCFGPLGPWLVAEVESVLAERVLSAEWSACDVRASEMGEGAAVRGAAALTLRSVLAQPWSVMQVGELPHEAAV